MSILQLRTFIEVYRQRSFSKAAETLHITQPAVSSHIASLESQIEHRLFVRHARGVHPTNIADDLAAQVGNSIDHAESALARIKSRSSKVGGVVHINGPIDMLSSLLAPHLKPLIDTGIHVRLHPTDGEAILCFLADGRSDFALCLAAPTGHTLDSCLLGEEQVLLVATPAIAARLSSNLEQALAQQPLVAYDLARALVTDWLQHNELFPEQMDEVITAPDLRCLRTLVLAGFGWSVLPEYLVRDDLKRGSLIAVDGPSGNLSMKYHLCWRAGAMRSPRIARVRELLQAQFAQ